ncbi:MAG: response regulator [Magnetococcales bacterium]|nr:response regulator [Magnetococcales bacterium]
MVLLLASQAILSHVGSNTVVHNFESYREASANSRTVLEIERSALELQQGVMLYTYSGYSGVVQRVLQVQRHLSAQLTRARTSVQDAARQDIVRRMTEHFQQYTENFNVAVSERELRDRFVDEQLAKVSHQLGDVLGGILRAAMVGGDMHGAALAGSALERFLLAHRNAMEYLHQPDSPLVGATQAFLLQLKKTLQEMQHHFRGDAARAETIDQLIALTPTYEQAFMGAVQASRAYMHLIYIVMGGEAAEILHLANELKEATLGEQSRLEQEISANVRNSQRAMIGISFAAILLGIILAWGITRNIATPIKAMTLTLTSLARGKEADIPGKGRSDEIGAMAMAAHVFKEKAHELENASRYKSEFLANMSHELRTPLNSLLILAKMLALNEEGNLSPRQVESARIIHDSGKDLLRLINDILDLSKVEAGHMELVPETRTLVDFTHGIDRLFRHVAESKGLAFQVEIASGLPSALTTDWTKVEQVVRNFLANAFKFTAAGAVNVRLGMPRRGHVFMNLELNSAEVVSFTVTDTGIGIPDDKQEQIFEPFRQVDGSISRKYGGTGLGLSISRKFAELLGGEVQVVSELGRGSAFTLYIPMEISRDATATVRARAALSDVPPPLPPTATQTEIMAFRSLASTILVVDDDPRNVFTLQRLLQSRAGTILVASHGREALDILARNDTVNLVLMDIMMPVMDGYEAMREIRKMPRYRQLPILALTAKAMSGDREKCLKAGASDYLAKPVELERLLVALATWLGRDTPSSDGPPTPGPTPQGISTTVKTETVSATPRQPGDPTQTIMIVDDDMRYAYALAQTLQKRIGSVLIAQNGTKAIELLEKHGHKVGLILLDPMLPGPDGHTTLCSIRGRGAWADIPVIMVSALDQQEMRDRCLAAGADDYLIKPVPEEELLARIAAILAKTKATAHGVGDTGPMVEPVAAKSHADPQEKPS